MKAVAANLNKWLFIQMTSIPMHRRGTSAEASLQPSKAAAAAAAQSM
jgi:hypothetical protein